jgi:N-acetylmuramoyl-L-alanine amidase
MFSNVGDANALKDKIVAKGVKDAFVVAYYKGKRYLPEDAALLLAREGNGILIGNSQVVQNEPKNDPVINEQPKNEPEIRNDPVVKEPVDTTAPKQPYVVKPNTAETDSGVVFKVQIGAFKDEVPIDIANKFIRIQKQGIKNYLDESSGLTVYTVGRFRTYEEAQKTRDGVMEQGMADAFVIAFKDGIKIPVEDAKKLVGH